jgi:hypothetical protein
MTTGCGRDAAASCFLPEATLPARDATLADPRLGASGRDLAAALFDRDLPRAEALLRGDRALASMKVGAHHDMLIVALATCEPRAVDLLLRHGAPRDGDGDGLPLGIALMATDPAFAHALLSAGASPTPPKNPLGPFRTAITAGSTGGVRMLLDFHGDPDVADELGHRPLLLALDTERFRIAELLLDRGADPWAIDTSGGNLGTAAYTPMVTADAEEAAAQRRLRTRLSGLGWPAPPPSPDRIRAMAVERQWPPQGANARPVPEGVRRVIAENAR